MLDIWARWSSDKPVVINIDGVDTSINTGVAICTVTSKEAMNQFIYNLADTILF